MLSDEGAKVFWYGHNFVIHPFAHLVDQTGLYDDESLSVTVPTHVIKSVVSLGPLTVQTVVPRSYTWAK